MQIIIIIAAALLISCSTAKYSFWELFGKEKRDLLKSEMVSAKSEQKEIQQQFKSNLDKIRFLYSFKEGELESTYDKVSSDYEDMNGKAEEFYGQIDDIQKISTDLFTEWKKEAYEFSSKDFRKKSLDKLSDTKKKFNQSLAKMSSVKRKLQQVLVKFKDRVIFLKHNLNAKMIGNFKAKFSEIDGEIKSLISSIESSNKSTESFIKDL